VERGWTSFTRLTAQLRSPARLFTCSNPAVLSIATNLAEGNGRFTKADRKNFFTIARGSAQECIPLLEIARRRNLIDETIQSECRQALETIAKMLSGLISGLDKRQT
jgi:four helix bundle protein